MKKSKLLCGLCFTVLSAGVLASCNYVKAKDGVILSIDGQEYTADELFHDQKSSAAVEKQFDAVYKVAVRKYFKDGAGKEKQNDIKKKTEIKIAGEKSTAQSNADKNHTSYDDEWNKILDSNGVDDEQGLYDKFEYDFQKEEFEDQFYLNNLDTLKHGGKLGDEDFKGYIPEKSPYHVKHILVKIAGMSDKDFSRAKITEDESKKLYNVIHELAIGTDFAKVARAYSDDTGSAGDKGGDLGIMDRDTSFVNDFKLGLYLYDSYFNSLTSNPSGAEGKYDVKDAKDGLGLNSDTEGTAGKYANNIANTIQDPTATSTEQMKFVGQIPLEAALLLGDEDVQIEKEVSEIEQGQPAFKTITGYAKYDYSDNGFDKVPNVTSNDAYLPRNIIFNKYFNKHNLMVITPTKMNNLNDVDQIDVANQKDKSPEKFEVNPANTADGKKYYLDDQKFPGFFKEHKNGEKVNGYDNQTNHTDSVLRDNNGRVILVFRSGNGSGEGSYQGIHFVVIERDPFIGNEYEKKDNVERTEPVTSDEYYTHYYPGQIGGNHPQYDDGTDKLTYVSYFNTPEVTEKQSRANTVKSKIKGYNSNLNTYIYKFLLKEGSLKFADNDIAKEINNNITKWIDVKREDTDYNNTKSYNETWRTWSENLQVQEYKRKEWEFEDPTTKEKDYQKSLVTASALDAFTKWTVKDNLEDIQKTFGKGGMFSE